MNEIKRTVIILLIILTQPVLVYAGSIDYNSNQSAKYFLNPAKAACTDGADTVAYNPAGTALMKPGMYLDVSEQFLMRFYEQDVSNGTLPDKTYKQDEDAYIFPNLFIVYNLGKTGPGRLAVYASAGVIGGGGRVKWDGTAGYDELALQLALQGPSTIYKINNKVEAGSLYIGLGAGVSYSLLKDLVSLSIGARFVHAEKDFNIDGKLEFISAAWTMDYNAKYDLSADGVSPILGFDIKPTRKLIIGLRYEFETKLEFEYDQRKNYAYNSFLSDPINTIVNSFFDVDGKKVNNNLPQIFSMGAEYIFTYRLSLSASGTFYDLSGTDMDGFEKFCNNGWDTSVGITYKFSRNLKAGAGFTYTDIGVKESLPENLQLLRKYSLNPDMNSLMYSLGITYSFLKNFDITLSGAYTYFLPENDKSISTAYGANLNMSYRKSIYSTALGVSCRL